MAWHRWQRYRFEDRFGRYLRPQTTVSPDGWPWWEMQKRRVSTRVVSEREAGRVAKEAIWAAVLATAAVHLDQNMFCISVGHAL